MWRGFCQAHDDDPTLFNFLLLVQHGQLSKLGARAATRRSRSPRARVCSAHGPHRRAGTVPRAGDDSAPSYAVRFHRSDAAPLLLAYDRQDLRARQCDLALLSPFVLGQRARTIEAAPETGADGDLLGCVGGVGGGAARSGRKDAAGRLKAAATATTECFRAFSAGSCRACRPAP